MLAKSPMSSPASRLLPPIPTIHAALEKTTEVLVAELGRASDSSPQWNEFEWQIAEATCALQGIAAVLANRLRWQGPERWRTFLAHQHQQTRLRQQSIRNALQLIDASARDAGLPIVGLKGSALLASNLYADGERPMADIDLLVRRDDTNRAAEVLQSLGYAEIFATSRDRTFAPRASVSAHTEFGEHIANPINIELHDKVSERLPVEEVDITDSILDRAMRPGLNPYPSNIALLRHLLLHAAGNLRSRSLRMIQLHDIALLSTQLTGEDWQNIAADAPKASHLWWMLPPLALIARYYPEAIPAAFLSTLEQSCPRLLRIAAHRHRLKDVSWSKMKIQAFPGIEWSRTLSEALRFMSSRIWPSSAALDELKLTTHATAYGKRSAWYDDSHWSRIVRWVFSNPPRVQTIDSVCRALHIDSGPL